MRHWIILRRTNDTGAWQEVTALTAWTRRGALAQVQKAGTYQMPHVAVPLSQWRPMEIPLKPL